MSGILIGFTIGLACGWLLNRFWAEIASALSAFEDSDEDSDK